MARVVLIDLFMFSLPFLLYGAYVVLVLGQRQQIFDAAPVLWLVAAGIGIVFVTMVAIVSFYGGPTAGDYHPPVYRNGQIQPGEID